LALTPLIEDAESFTGGLAYGRNVRFGSKADVTGGLIDYFIGAAE